MKRIFEIEWDDDNGPLWVNRDNLLTCLIRACPNAKFTVRDVTNDGECDTRPASSGPNSGRYERIVGAVARGWCHKENENKVIDADLVEAIAQEVDNVV